MATWWERYPEILEKEISALNDIAHLGYTWSIDEAEKANGLLVIKIEKGGADGDLLKFEAHYPDSFPYFQPMVRLDNVTLGRHHHPTGKNLCLLEREGEAWQPGRDTLAGLLRDQLPIVLQITNGEMSPGEVAHNEDHVGEPVASFLPYVPNCVPIGPDKTPPEEVNHGRLTLFVQRKPDKWISSHPFINGIVQKILDPHQLPIVQFPCPVPGFEKQLPGFWLRLTAPPKISNDKDIEELVALMAKSIPTFDKAVKTARRGEIVIAGFVYRDEVTWRSEADDWIFVAVEITQEAKRSRATKVNYFFVRADWGGEDAYMRRAPSLRPLRIRKVLLFGLGSLGSPVALQLARSGIGQLHLMDSDYLQVGNTVRWALGWQGAGLHKALALKMHIAVNYPLTKVLATDLRLGFPRATANERPADYDTLLEAVQEADVVIDASANQRVSNFLADLTTELGKPFLWLTTTPGTAGGVVGRVVPGRTTGCWHCFQRSMADGSIKQPMDLGSINIQPAGCSAATFVGAGIDSDEVALLATRLAVATLMNGEPDCFPDFDWNVAVVDLKQDGISMAPRWTTYPLNKNPSCACA